jgi:hypothetical protein
MECAGPAPGSSASESNPNAQSGVPDGSWRRDATDRTGLVMRQLVDSRILAMVSSDKANLRVNRATSAFRGAASLRSRMMADVYGDSSPIDTGSSV